MNGDDQPLRLRDFLLAVAEASRAYGIIITDAAIERRDDPQGIYALDPNTLRMGWKEA